jgi:hypothetical protein
MGDLGQLAARAGVGRDGWWMGQGNLLMRRHAGQERIAPGERGGD